MAIWNNSIWDQVLESPPTPERRGNHRERRSDRRRESRHHFFHPVSLETMNGKIVSGYSSDASVTGLFLVPMGLPKSATGALIHPLTRGESVTLTIHVDGQKVEFACMVTRLTHKGIGLSFLSATNNLSTIKK